MSKQMTKNRSKNQLSDGEKLFFSKFLFIISLVLRIFVTQITQISQIMQILSVNCKP